MCDRHIITVEDEPLIDWQVRLKIEELGHVVIPMDNPEEALLFMEKKHPDALIINLRLDWMKHPAIPRLVHIAEQLPIPLLVITGAGSKELRDNCPFLAGHAFLLKPFANAQLGKQIKLLFRNVGFKPGGVP